MSEVKLFLIEGYMLIDHDKNPRWQKFSIVKRGLKPEHVKELVYSELGSRHKLKRYHIKITNIREISPEEVEDIHIKRLVELDRWYL